MKNFLLKRVLPSSTPHCVSWSSDGKLALTDSEFTTVLYLESYSSLDTIVREDTLAIAKTSQIPNVLPENTIENDEKLMPSLFGTDTLCIGVFWSPSGYGPRGNTCILAVFTASHDVHLFEQEPDYSGPKWLSIGKLSDLFTGAGTGKLLNQKEAEKRAISSFSWAKATTGAIRALKTMYIGTLSGEVLAIGWVDNRLKILGLHQFPPEKGYVVALSCSEWRRVNDQEVAQVIACFSDGSVSCVDFATQVSKEKYIFRHEIEVRPKDTRLPGNVLVETTEKGESVAFLVYSGSVEAYLIGKTQSYNYKFSTFGDFRAIYNNHCLILVAAIYSGPSCLVSLKLGDEGFTPVECEPLSRLFADQNIDEGTYLRVFGVFQSPTQKTIGALFHKVEPFFTVFHTRLRAQCCLSLTSVSGHTPVDVLDLSLWKLVENTPENWLLEAVLAQEASGNENTITNAEVTETRKAELTSVFEHSPMATQAIYTLNGFYEDLEASIRALLNSNFYKTLHFFKNVIRRPEMNSTDYVGLPELARMEALAQHEREVASFEKIALDLDRLGPCCLAKIVVELGRKYNIFALELQELEERLFLFGMLAVCRDELGMECPELDSVEPVNVSLYDGVLQTRYDFKKQGKLSVLIDQNGVEWERCASTLIPILDTRIRTCQLCRSVVHLFSGESNLAIFERFGRCFRCLGALIDRL